MPSGQITNSQMKELLSSEYQRTNDPAYMARVYVSKYLSLGNLRGFWGPGVLLPAAGGFYITDMSGNGFPMLFNISSPLIASGIGYHQWQFDGIRYAATADAPQWDIVANEAFSVFPGISMGCWFFGDRNYPWGTPETLISKWLGANDYSYILYREAALGGTITFGLSTNGQAATVALFDHNKAIAKNQWYFVAVTFTPGGAAGEPAGVRIWVNDDMQYHAVSDRGAAGLPVSIFNGAALLKFGDSVGAQFYGWMTNWWISGAYLREGDIFNLWASTKNLFGFQNEKGTSW